VRVPRYLLPGLVLHAAEQHLLAADRVQPDSIGELQVVAPVPGPERARLKHRRSGSPNHRSTTASSPIVAQGRDEDAVAELEQARGIYGKEASWKAARARLLARRGETEEAVALAREALDAMSGNDDITARAEILVDVAEVLGAHGDLAEAAAALAEAVVLHEEKGNAIPAERCRELLASIPAQGTPNSSTDAPQSTGAT
jgi:tetratricopeptide (TPR) repeat protein